MILTEALFRLLAPHDCMVCGSEGALLCRWCYESVTPVPDRCYKCHKASTASTTCSSCKKKSKLRHVWIRADYASHAEALIKSLKFSRNKDAAKTIANLLDQKLPYLSDDVLITHIPTASSRVRARGYDQAQLIAKELARLRGLHHIPLLARIGSSRQVGARRAERLKQLEQAYRPINSYMIEGAQILLVDDVLTTGATLETAGSLLRTSGAKQVSAAVFAQAK